MNRKRLTALLLVMLLIVSMVAACNKDNNAQTPSPTENTGTGDGPGPVVPGGTFRDLGGLEIIVSDWWSDNEAVEGPALNLRDEEWREYRDMIFEEANFTLRRENIGGWGDSYMELFTTTAMANDWRADVYIMQADWAFNLMKQGLLYPLDTIDSLNLSDAKWNQAAMDPLKMGGHTYAITAEEVEPRGFIFFNKRMFQDAGIDPDEPYALQETGEWTWDKFIEYCEILTRDTDGDGIDDVFGFTGFAGDAIPLFLASNGSRYFDINADGTYRNATQDPATLRALQFVANLEKYMPTAPSEVGDGWAWMREAAFIEGHAAMITQEMYATRSFEAMSDDWGVLMPPKGPDMDEYNTYIWQNVMVMPFNIDPQRAEDIMYGYNLYYEPLPYDLANPDFWKDGGWGYSRVRDAKSVDITLSMFYEQGLYFSKIHHFVDGISWGDLLEYGIWDGEAVAGKIEAMQPVVDAALASFNELILAGAPEYVEPAESTVPQPKVDTVLPYDGLEDMMTGLAGFETDFIGYQNNYAAGHGRLALAGSPPTEWVDGSGLLVSGLVNGWDGVDILLQGLPDGTYILEVEFDSDATDSFVIANCDSNAAYVTGGPIVTYTFDVADGKYDGTNRLRLMPETRDDFYIVSITLSAA